MALEEAMALTNRLLTSAYALAAVTARLRLDELGDGGDPEVRAQLDRIADILDARELTDGLDEHERAVVVAFARSYLGQALDLAENPLREPGWSHTDPVLLQAQGSASAGVARLFEAAGLGAPGVRILDVGTGVAGLAIAFCRTYPEATVVGIDPWQPALELAARNVEEAGLGSRITLVASTIEEFRDDDGFDLAWLPSFFIPERALDDAIGRVHELLRPGGTIAVGTTTAGEESLESAVDRLINLRSGGSAISAEEALQRLERAGFSDVRQPDLGLDVPLRLGVGTRA
jgi:ubiquinone/menaquinone biosynthesis C-methylase UbiE